MPGQDQPRTVFSHLRFDSDDPEFNAQHWVLDPSTNDQVKSANSPDRIIGIAKSQQKVMYTGSKEHGNLKIQNAQSRVSVKAPNPGGLLAESLMSDILQSIREPSDAKYQGENYRYAKTFLVTRGLKPATPLKEVPVLAQRESLDGDNLLIAEGYEEYLADVQGQSPHDDVTVEEEKPAEPIAEDTSPINHGTAENFIENGLFVASRWQPNTAFSKSARALFGYTSRPKVAGSFDVELFEGMRSLDERLGGVGLSQVFLSTAFMADMDAHSDNANFNIDTSSIKNEKLKKAAQNQIDALNALFNKDGSRRFNREEHLNRLITTVRRIQSIVASDTGLSILDEIQEDLKQYDQVQKTKHTSDLLHLRRQIEQVTKADDYKLTAVINFLEKIKDPADLTKCKYQDKIDQIKQSIEKTAYYHRIDFDVAYSEFCSLEEKPFSFRDHGTSPVKVGALKTKATNHAAEMLVGKDPETFLFSNTMMKMLQANPIEQRLESTREAMEKLFDSIHSRSNKSIQSKQEQLRAEYLLLKYFEQHITTASKKTLSVLKVMDEEQLKDEINKIQVKMLSAIQEATMHRYVHMLNEFLDFPVSESYDNQAAREILLSLKQKTLMFQIGNSLKKIILVAGKKGLRYDSLSNNEKALYDNIQSASYDVAAGQQTPSQAHAAAASPLDMARIEAYLLDKNNATRPLHQVICQVIGIKFASVYTEPKSAFQRFREELAGLRKVGFWGGLAVVGLASAFIVSGIFFPVMVPAIAICTIVGGAGLMSTIAATVTNNMVTRWFRQAPLWQKVAFGIAVAAVVAGVTVLTGGAALVAAGAAATVVGGALGILGVKAAAVTTPVLIAKAGVGAAGGIEALSLAKHAQHVAAGPKTTSARSIAKKLGVNVSSLKKEESLAADSDLSVASSSFRGSPDRSHSSPSLESKDSSVSRSELSSSPSASTGSPLADDAASYSELPGSPVSRSSFNPDSPPPSPRPRSRSHSG